MRPGSTGASRMHIDGWSIMAVGMLVVVGLVSVGIVLVARWGVRQRRRHDGLCPVCGYDLRATPGRCPECGAVARPEQSN